MLSARRHARFVEERRFDLFFGHFIEILGLITCKRCRLSHRPKNTFGGSAPCEDVINEGLVDGRAEGWIGVQVERVESEAVLNCKGNKNESACDMLC